MATKPNIKEVFEHAPELLSQVEQRFALYQLTIGEQTESSPSTVIEPRIQRSEVLVGKTLVGTFVQTYDGQEPLEHKFISEQLDLPEFERTITQNGSETHFIVDPPIHLSYDRSTLAFLNHQSIATSIMDNQDVLINRSLVRMALEEALPEYFEDFFYLGGSGGVNRENGAWEVFDHNRKDFRTGPDAELIVRAYGPDDPDAEPFTLREIASGELEGKVSLLPVEVRPNSLLMGLGRVSPYAAILSALYREGKVDFTSENSIVNNRGNVIIPNPTVDRIKEGLEYATEVLTFLEEHQESFAQTEMIVSQAWDTHYTQSGEITGAHEKMQKAHGKIAEVYSDFPIVPSIDAALSHLEQQEGTLLEQANKLLEPLQAGFPRSLADYVKIG
jgi:hypothetical protein